MPPFFYHLYNLFAQRIRRANQQFQICTRLFSKFVFTNDMHETWKSHKSIAIDESFGTTA